MKKKILMLCLVFSVICAGAAEKGGSQSREKFIKGYSGGMFLHTGYLSGGDNPYGFNPHGATFGIGGLVKLRASEHFRFGAEGYVSTLGLDEGVEKGSFNKMFWSGALCDFYWTAGRFIPYVGVSVGGGVETSYYMFEGNKNDWHREDYAVFNKQAFFALDPFVGFEYAVGKAFHLSLKLDWLVAVNSGGINRPSGPRLYFGFIFAH